MAIASAKPSTSPVGAPAARIIARVPYLNCAPFFTGLTLAEGWQWRDIAPRQFGAEAEAGRMTAGPMSLVDYLRLQGRVERLGALGIATRGRCGSALLFSRKPVRQLDGATVGVTEETSTTALLLRLILEQRLQLPPLTYQRYPTPALIAPGLAVDAMLLIGDEALRFRTSNRWYPYEFDVGFEWWVWQHLPSVFAVWAVQRGADPADVRTLSRTLQHQLAVNLGRLGELASAKAASVGMSVEEAKMYLENFIYRFSTQEEEAITRFAQLVHEHRLL